MELPLSKSRMQKINDMIELMDLWLTRREQEIAAGTYYDDDDDDDCKVAEGNTMPTPTQPFSDSPPEKIHGQPDQELWPPKPKSACTHRNSITKENANV
jgi:hypothetical protein